MRKIRLLGVAPYEGMYRLMLNLAAQRNDVELTVYMGNLEEGLEAVRHKDKERHIDAIISRGGTSEILRQAVDVPVYDVAPSVYDILRTIRLAQEMGESFAVVAYPTIAKHACTLCEIMSYDYTVRTIHSEAECDAALRELREQGIRIIVGDTITVQSCKARELHGLLIVSGIESIENAIDHAVEMYHHYEAVARRSALFSDVLSTARSAVLIFSPDGAEIFRSAAGISDELTAKLRERISNVITQRSVKLIERSGQSFYTIYGRRIVSIDEDYCVFSISSGPAKAAAMDKYRIRFLSADAELPGSYPLDFYIGGGNYADGLRSICERYASVDTPVLLLGPRGTGKGRIAHFIYSRSRFKHSAMVWIDISELTEKGWDFLMDSEDSPLLDTGLTVFFRDVNKLDRDRSRVLLAYLRNTGAARTNRLLFSYDSEGGSPAGDMLYDFLAGELRCAQLHTLPISGRLQDIQALAGLCINTFNVQFGTQVVGLSREAVLLIQNHAWSRNIDQFVQFMSRLVAGSSSSYISEDEVRHLLALERKAALSNAGDSIDLSLSLNEISREIVRRVYLSEDMNQTRTAKRLGISRSTVWRMLKD